MKKKIIFSVLLTMLLFVSLSPRQKYKNTVKQLDLYANQIDAKKIDNAKDMAYELGLGINIGDTFGYWDTTQSIKSYGRTWNPLPTQAFYNSLHEAGFDSVRLAVNWYMFTSDPANGDYTISDDYLNIIRNQIEMAINAKLYVIINIHSETGHKGQPGNQCAAAGIPGGECMVDATDERFEISKNYLESIWSQVAEEYKDIDERLLFEGFNEILGTSGWADSAASLKQNEANNTNALNQIFVDTVRSKGGYNPTRFLLCNAYATNIASASKFVYPKTNGVKDNRVLVGFHNYDVWKYLDGRATSTDIVNKASIFGEFWTGYSPEYMISSCAAVEAGNASENQTKACQRIHIDTYMKKLLDNKIAVFIWDDGGNAHSLVNRKATSVDNLWKSLTGYNTSTLGNTIMEMRKQYTDISVGTETEVSDDNYNLENNSEYEIKNKTIYVVPNTTEIKASELLNKLHSTISIEIYNNDIKISTNDYVGTGYKIKVQDDYYNIVVLGDITGDGKISLGDVSALYNHYKGNKTLQGLKLEAGKLTGNNQVLLGDVSKLYNFYRGVKL